MAYITRELERKFLKLNDFFKVILVTGARQVGKTTMLKHLAGSDRTYVTISRRSLLMRCRKRRSCSSKSKSFVMRVTKKASFG